MIVEIKATEIGTENIRLIASNLEKVLTSDDLFETFETEEVIFTFPKNSTPARKYLLKICQSQKKSQNKYSLGDMIESLPGCILSVGESWIEH